MAEVPTPNEASAESVAARADALNGVGAQLFGQGQLEPARLHFLAALALVSDHAQALQNLGAVLRNMGHHDAAASVARRSVVANNTPFTRSNLGVAQLSQKKYEAARKTLFKVTQDLPSSAPSWHNYGLVLYMMGRREEALRAFNRSLELARPNPHCESDRALTLLSLGRIKEGLAAYEVRWEILKKSSIWDLNIPEWKGQSLARQHVLVHHEQGFGDGIMLSRFLRPLAQSGAHITVAVPQELLRLMQGNFGHLAKIVDIKDKTALALPFDYHIPFLSLVRYIGIKKPAHIIDEPYLTNMAEDDITLPQTTFRVGVCWASGDHGPALRERRRYVPLTQLLPFTELPSTAVVSLQKGADTKDIARWGMEGLIYDAAPRLVDFAATAAVIDQLDVVVSVDSAVAHLAAAMGKPTVMLSPYTRCWRWWGGKTGWPWYSDMAIFDQSEDGTWTTALDEALMAVMKRQEMKAEGEAHGYGRCPADKVYA